SLVGCGSDQVDEEEFEGQQDQPAPAVHRGCSTVEPTDAEKVAIESELAATPIHQSLTTTTIPTYVHVIRNSSGGGDVSDSMINSQITVLNNAYAAYGFQFSK